MNPQQTPYQPPPPPGANYDFFLSPQKPPKPSPLSGLFGGGSSMAIRIAVIAIGAFIVVIVLYFFLSLFSSDNSPKLILVAQDQNELSRVASLANTLGQSQSSTTTQNFAGSASLCINSEQKQLLAYLTAHGLKLSTKQLEATKDTSTDTELSSSVQSSSFNATYNSIMQSQLSSYQTALQGAFKTASSTSLKQLLSSDYKAAGLLLRQLNNSDQ